ncbi:MAG TPA: hypothetical protein PLY93_08330 [Turneriella sp.]|nr:hypothetical protein [Turneriella sp.]
MRLKDYFILPLVLLSPLWTLQPNERISEDVGVYIEGAPLAESLPTLKAVVTTVAGEGAWDLMASSFETRSGINIFDLKKLHEIGVDTKSPWGIAFNKETEIGEKAYKPEFVGILPTLSGSSVYNLLKEKITEVNLDNLKEIENGKILSWGTEADPGFLIQTDDAILLSNNLEFAKKTQKRASSPIAKTHFYKDMRAYFIKKNANKQPLAAFYLNPKLLVSLFDAQKEFIAQLQKGINEGSTDEAIVSEDSPLIKEISDNLEASGGAFIVQNNRLTSYFSYKYKSGYLNDTTKFYPRILQVKAQPLTSDTLSTTPIHYGLLKLNVVAIFDLLKTLSPLFNNKYTESIDKINDKLHVDIQKQVIDSFRGNFNFQIMSIPAPDKLQDITQWGLSGSFGIKSGTSAGWLDFFKAVDKEAKKFAVKRKNKAKIKFTYENHDEGSFVLITLPPDVTNSKKTTTIAILIREDEIIISNSKTGVLKVLKGSETTLSERLLRLPYDTTQAVFFVDLQQVLKALQKAKEAAAFKPYLAMLEKLKYFSITSNIEGDFAGAEFSLHLRK